jgi:hypothetical protein
MAAANNATIARPPERDGRKTMSDWKLFYQDENGRDAQSIHSNREALHLARRCQIQKIEGPNGERIDKERFERVT